MLNLMAYLFIIYPVYYEEYIVDANRLKGYDTFIFSDSHGWSLTKNSIDNKIRLDSLGIFNFSYGSDSYYDIYIKLNYLLQNNVNIDTVLVTADDHMISYYRQNSNNVNRSVVMATPSTFKDSYNQSILYYLIRKYLFRFFPMIKASNSQLMKKFLTHNIKTNIRTNFAGEDSSKTTSLSSNWSNTVDKKTVAINRLKTVFPKDSYSQSLKSCLIEIISLSKKHDITVIGVKFPLTREFVESTAYHDYNVESIFKKRGCRVLNAQKILYDQEEMFANQDHVNNRGGKIFIHYLRNNIY